MVKFLPRGIQLNDLQGVLKDFPGLSIKPMTNQSLVLAGDLSFSASHPKYDQVEDSFALEIAIPSNFPTELPQVRETGERIPNTFHTNPDGSLCLGAPLRLRIGLGSQATLRNFIGKCCIPFLYGFVLYSRGGDLPFGDLAHGVAGLLEEYKQILNLSDDGQCIRALSLLGLKRRVANKRACPCGSGKQLRQCHSARINRLRVFASRGWYREHAEYLMAHYSKV